MTLFKIAMVALVFISLYLLWNDDSFAGVELTTMECAPRAEWIRHMGIYGENVVHSGVASRSRATLFEIWANTETGSWTTLYTENYFPVKEGAVLKACSPSSGWNFK